MTSMIKTNPFFDFRSKWKRPGESFSFLCFWFFFLPLFIDLLTDKVQPLSRQRKFQTEMDAGIVLINTANQRKMSPVKLPQRLSERVEALTLKFGYVCIVHVGGPRGVPSGQHQEHTGSDHLEG